MRLRHLDDYLRKRGYGTALVDPDDALDDTWYGLLVWEIADGAKAGVAIRYEQGQFTFDDGTHLSPADDELTVHHALTTFFNGRRDR